MRGALTLEPAWEKKFARDEGERRRGLMKLVQAGGGGGGKLAGQLQLVQPMPQPTNRFRQFAIFFPQKF